MSPGQQPSQVEEKEVVVVVVVVVVVFVMVVVVVVVLECGKYCNSALFLHVCIEWLHAYV